jgi:acetolactate synthase-1/2/3 large subunit
MTTQEETIISRDSREPETAAEHVVHYLANQGVDAIFGIPGGHISPFLGALRRQERVRYIIARHESGAAFMADGYARASGRLGVCLVTAGPGATNAMTGLAAAHLDCVPVLLISGQVPTDRWGLGAMQESTTESGVDIVRALRHASAYSACIVEPRSFVRQFGRALAVLNGCPGAAVHLSIPHECRPSAAWRVERPGMDRLGPGARSIACHDHPGDARCVPAAHVCASPTHLHRLGRT